MSESDELTFTKAYDKAVNIEYTSKKTQKLKSEVINKMYIQRNTHSNEKIKQKVERNKKIIDRI